MINGHLQGPDGALDPAEYPVISDAAPRRMINGPG
jgi:hypothetical protein